ncbi:MAG TPA: hypothetical protein VFW73_04070 [Lacipirellulaceae bacterium]|nr:hypothetical protein [Lacipirellulaceae bacterium]
MGRSIGRILFAVNVAVAVLGLTPGSARASSLWGADWGGYLGYPTEYFEIDPPTGGLLSVNTIPNSNPGAGILDFASDPTRAPAVVWSLHNTLNYGYELMAFNPYEQRVLSRTHLNESLALQTLAIDPTTGVFYSTSATSLYTLDPVSGAAVLVGATVVPADGALGCDLEGNLFGVEEYGNDPVALLRLNKSTGEATAIAAMAAQPADIAVRPEDDVLYGLGFSDDPGSTYSLYKIDRNTAAITNIGPSVFRPAGLAFTNVPEPAAIALTLLLTPLLLWFAGVHSIRAHQAEKQANEPIRMILGSAPHAEQNERRFLSRSTPYWGGISR